MSGRRVNEAVRRHLQHKHAERQRGKILLVFEISVQCQERVTSPRRSAQKLAIGKAGPAETNDGVDLVPDQIRVKIHRKILVK